MMSNAGDELSLGTGGSLVTGSGGTGDLSVVVTPVSATWTLYGPTAFSGDGSDTGSGSANYTDIPAGAYILRLNAKTGYLTPSDKSGVLTTDGTLTLTAAYIDKSSAGMIGVIANVVALLQDDPNTSGYHIFDRFESSLGMSADKFRTGVIEVDVDPRTESEPEHWDDGHAQVRHRLLARIHIAHANPSTARDQCLVMVEEFKEAIETAESNLGMSSIWKNTLRFDSVSIQDKSIADAYDQLDIRTAFVRFSVVEFQSPRSRPNAG